MLLGLIGLRGRIYAVAGHRDRGVVGRLGERELGAGGFEGSGCDDAGYMPHP